MQYSEEIAQVKVTIEEMTFMEFFLLTSKKTVAMEGENSRKELDCPRGSIFSLDEC